MPREDLSLGKLELGIPAGFIILDQDPRTNVDVIAGHQDLWLCLRFLKVRLVLNKLVRIDVESNEQIEVAGQSYAPPPSGFAIILSE